MNFHWLKSQGYMNVESQALDDAFADTDVDPRQRLVSLEIDTGLDMIDCARAVFADPDGRISKAIRTGPTTKGDVLRYVPWTARLGYFGEDPEEMTTMSGVPMMEVVSFPETGHPEVTIKIMSPAVALRKNTTPGGGVEEYIGIGGTGKVVPALRKSLEAIAKYYGLGEPEFGDSGMDDVITTIDGIIQERNRLAMLDLEPRQVEYRDKPSLPYWQVTSASTWSRIPADKNDATYLARIAGKITILVQSSVINKNAEYVGLFGEALLGNASKSDLRVVWGVWNNKLLFCFARDYLRMLKLDKIPVIDYHCGNNLLISFDGQIDSANDQSGWWATISNWFTGEKNSEVDAPDPLKEMVPPTTASVEADSLNAFVVDKHISVVGIPPDNSVATAILDIDALTRSLNTDIKGEVETYGNRYYVAGNLVCLNGLGWGLSKEFKVGEEQQFASYDRIYLVGQATHHMDSSGFYTVKVKVEGCSMDESEEKAKEDFTERTEQGIEIAPGPKSFWDFLK